MRETLRHLASIGKTVFVSSHLLGEVQQLADVVGIIAAGRLVREGPIEELLAGEGVVRVRVAPDEIAAPARLDGARHARRRRRASSRRPAEHGWLTVQVDPDRAAEVNRALADGRDLRLRARDRQRPRDRCSWS